MRTNDDYLGNLVGYMYVAIITLGTLLLCYLLTHPPKTEESAPSCQCECVRRAEGGAR